MLPVATTELEHFAEVTQVRRNRHFEIAAPIRVISAAPLDDLHGFDAGKLLEHSFNRGQRCGPGNFISRDLEYNRDVVWLNHAQHLSPTLKALLQIHRRRL